MSIGVPLSGSRLGLDVGTPVTPPASVPCSSRHTPTLAIRVVVLEKVKRDVPYILQTQQSIPAEAVLALPNPKTDPKPYAFALGALVAFVRKHIAGEDAGSIVLRPADRADLDTALRIQADPTDANGKYDDRAEIQLSPAELVDARKAIIPLALVLLCALPELASANSTSSADIPGPMTKAEIADELHKLVALWPDGNPPRAALRRVNEYLMSEGRRGGG